MFSINFSTIKRSQNAVITRKPFYSHKIGVRGLIESLNNVGIHFGPTHVHSGFDNVNRALSNNKSWQLSPGFNDPLGGSGLPSVQPETAVM